MRKTLSILGLTFILLVALDGIVALTLGWSERSGRLGSLVRYFEYGRSVPGKLENWEQNPGTPGNLFDVAWRSAVVGQSREGFLAEAPNAGPVIRSYGMSFVNNIIRAAIDVRSEWTWNAHAGPGAPPNFTFALFEEDQENRRAGDIVVLGILSSAIPAMAALSNSTWAFEQPAPFTYPIYWPENRDLRRVEPIINSAAEQRAVTRDITARRAWEDQLAHQDYFFSPQTFGLTWADRSPFLRLVRRSLAKSHVERTAAEILSGDYPYRDVLQRMVAEFASMARADGQTPVVMLIQSRDPGDPDVLEIVRSVLKRDKIRYLATAEHVDPGNPSNFLGDGHYKPQIDRAFGDHFIELIEQ